MVGFKNSLTGLLLTSSAVTGVGVGGVGFGAADYKHATRAVAAAPTPENIAERDNAVNTMLAGGLITTTGAVTTGLLWRNRKRFQTEPQAETAHNSALAGSSSANTTLVSIPAFSPESHLASDIDAENAAWVARMKARVHEPVAEFFGPPAPSRRGRAMQQQNPGLFTGGPVVGDATATEEQRRRVAQSQQQQQQ